MFRIPDFYQDNALTFDNAVATMTAHGRGDLLAGMQAMDNCWLEHCSGSPRFEDDEDFFDTYEYEVNAYNVVFEKMSVLFQ
jgi:hypothetical protein